MNILITGGAGFIGSHLTKSLIEEDHNVFCVDNLELGNMDNIKDYLSNNHFKFYENDVSNIEILTQIMKESNIELVFHLAANSDIQKSGINPTIDYKNTFLTTYSVLESMRISGTKKLFFASTSAVYGEKLGVLLKEDIGDLSPISYYGGAKLASEAFISSYAYMNDFDVTIFRFPNVIGPNLTHGVIFDFIKKLEINPNKLQILGDGTQCKPYIYVLDLINAIINITFNYEKGVNIYNLGVEDQTTVREIADIVCNALNLKDIEYEFTSGNRGWKGDVPNFQYDLSKIHNHGWNARFTSNEAVKLTVENVINKKSRGNICKQ